MARYGKLVIRKNSEGKLELYSAEPAVLLQVIQNRKVRELLIDRSDENSWLIAETVLVTKIKALVLATAMVAAPTKVFPAPQGSTTTPEPPSQNRLTACS